jgi:hypothetical protein
MYYQFNLKLPKLHHVYFAGDINTGNFFNNKEAALVVSIIWYIWSSRNKFVHGKQFYQPLKSFQLIEEHMENLELRVNEKGRVIHVQKWQKSPVGWHAVDTDGSLDMVNRTAGSGGSGFVIRDDLATFIQAGSIKQSHVEDSSVSELLGCREGLEAASRIGLEKVIIQTDCSGLVSLWYGECIHILKELKVLSSTFQDFKILFVKR